MTTQPETMIDIDRAHELLFAQLRPLPTVSVPLSQALYATLAEAIRCDVDHPPFDRSLMDGYAVRAEDTAQAPVALRIVGQIPAGSVSARTLGADEAMQINTGAPVPAGADAVVRVEETEPAGDGRVLVKSAVPGGNFITRQGEYVRAGETVLEPGIILTPAAIGAAAAAGAATVKVYRPPSVAVLSTGDELVDLDRKPTGAQIRNSNQHQLAALIESAHCPPVLLGTVGDDREALRAKMDRGSACDVMCITGGASVGPLDLVPDVLRECGARFHFQKMAIKPGRPIHFATLPSGTSVFALPGNPVSAFVGFELLVRPALAALQGRPGRVPPLIQATLEGNVPATRARRTYLPATAWLDAEGHWHVATTVWHGSGDMFGLARADALIVRPPDARGVDQGERVSMLLLDRI